MDEEQGGAGGVPLHHDDDGAEDRRKPHVTTRATDPGTGEHRERRDDGRTAAADTDEASRLDRPQKSADPRDGRTRWTGPRDPDPDGK
ncbi:hypothetical protein [Streptomyces sp. WAC06614]|uniref:hypothetical protein n=1 Tax=Streptomyces sp. WAC06614 TaxID=2487416 RepID=UPI000F78CF8C|nr:hypothetical protein [Streptomyces sp. WAC06614]RSS81935.1 hypothetical protein EF918_08665 [Streptomyces sp. WAC06614]